MKLYTKLALVLTLTIALIGLSFVLVSQSLSQQQLAQASQEFNRDLARDLVADRNMVTQGEISEEALKSTFAMYMTVNPAIEIYLLDLDGRILSYSADPGKVKRKGVDLEPIHKFLDGNIVFPILGDDPRDHDERKVFSVTAVPSVEDPQRYLYVVLRGEAWDSVAGMVQSNQLLRQALWVLAGSLLFGLAAGLLLFALLTRRLRRLAGLMANFRASEFSQYEPYNASSKNDEIDTLGESFDLMAQRISDTLGQLHRQDSLRRELLNNVSHDLRTPLTSMRGYLETLELKSEELNEEKKKEYIKIALRHTQRLGRLIDELFELSRLDAKDIKPKPEPFVAAELIQDIAQKFRLPAEQKEIQLQVKLPQTTLMVEADIGLVERVMENLIANALHHTPAGGRVVIALVPRGERLLVVVGDTGCGIPSEALPHVFERFYRGTHNKGDERNHAGLGLAIANRIVSLHGSKLQVVSREGKGTKFAFTLPVWDRAQAL